MHPLFQKEEDVSFVRLFEPGPPGGLGLIRAPVPKGREYEYELLMALVKSLDLNFPKKVPILGVCLRKGLVAGEGSVLVRVQGEYGRAVMERDTGIPQALMGRAPLFSEEPKCGDMGVTIPEAELKKALGMETVAPRVG